MPKRIAGLLVLVAVLVTSGLLACVAPAAAPAPAATATPEPTLTRPEFPGTPVPSVVIPGDITPVTTTNTYAGGGTHRVDLKAGDIVELTLRITGGGVALSVDEPIAGFAAMMPRMTDNNSTSKHAFVARVDGTYSILMQGGNNPMGAGVVILSVSIYRKGAPPTT